MPDDELLERLQHFHHNAFPQYRAQFQALVQDGQHPTTLFIGCSDSRLLPYLLTGAGQITGIQRLGNRLGMLSQTAQANGQVQCQYLHAPAEIRYLRQQASQQGQRQHCQTPGQYALSTIAAAGWIQCPFDALHQRTKAHQRMPTAWLAERNVQGNGGQHGQFQAQHAGVPQLS